MVRREFATSASPSQSVRPLVLGRNGTVSAGHALAARAGEQMFDLGGTAIDAGIASLVAINVVLFHWADFGGVAPIVLYHAPTDRVVTLDGLGVWPARTDIARLGEDELPQGIRWSVTPGAPDAWMTALAEFGTLTLGEVVEPAWHLAEHGAPVNYSVATYLRNWEEHVREHYPTTLEAFYPEGRPYEMGEVLYRKELARVLKALMDAEAAARRQGLDRREAIRAARDLFYRGWIATELADFFAREDGWITRDDLAAHAVEVAPAITTSYRGYDVFACGPWCQGPVLLQTLNILERFDLQALGHNSVPYLHLLAESIDRAYADKETYFGDPRQVPVPIEGLLSKEYAGLRAATIDRDRATGAMPEPGDPWAFERTVERDGRFGRVDVATYEGVSNVRIAGGAPPPRDTSYCAAADAEGNLFSATPSDGSLWAPVVPSLGFPCSSRGVQSRLSDVHPSGVAPGRRPRLTPNPALVGAGGVPLLGFGCPGGDNQPQAMLQVFLNLVEFGMDLQQAVEAPRVGSWNFPNSFAPHPYYPGRLDVEGRVPEPVAAALAELGHAITRTDDWVISLSAVHAASVDLDTRVVAAAADPRVDGAAIAW